MEHLCRIWLSSWYACIQGAEREGVKGTLESITRLRLDARACKVLLF